MLVGQREKELSKREAEFEAKHRALEERHREVMPLPPPLPAMLLLVHA